MTTTHIHPFQHLDAIVRANHASLSVEYVPGHTKTAGRHSNIMKNPLWKIKMENGEIKILMQCEPNDTLCILCESSYQKIIEHEQMHNDCKKITWYKLTNGYISSSCSNLHMHQVITGCHGNGKGTSTVSVDHINRDPLDNRFCNLRVATFHEQHQNAKGMIPGTKRDRKWNAKQLPDGIEQSMLRKYVVYYSEIYDKKTGKMREFFKVEKHPKLQKPWMSSKSCKTSTFEKLEQANAVVDNLEHDIYPNDTEEDASILPKCIYMSEFRNKPHLVFDMRKDGSDKRLSLKMVLPTEYNLQDELERFREKIIEKYGDIL